MLWQQENLYHLVNRTSLTVQVCLKIVFYIEMRVFIHNIVPYGNMGCSGGSQEVSILYIIDNDGIATENSYPYIANVSFEWY